MASEEELEALITRHQSLDDRVDEMNKLYYLSPQEQTTLKELKLLRLQLKRAIHTMQDPENACN